MKFKDYVILQGYSPDYVMDHNELLLDLNKAWKEEVEIIHEKIDRMSMKKLANFTSK